MDTINNFAEKLEGIPGYDMAVDWINDKVGEKYQTKDPFYVEIHGKKKRRKAPETCTKQEQKAWKRIKKKAWLDDRNFFGCYPIDLGLGLAPLLAILPVIGPLMMFAVHGRLVSIADQEFHLSPKLVTQMHGNIAFDLLISFPPIIGSLFAWLNGCSTRNAALVHTELVKRERQKEQERLQRLNLPNQQAQFHSPDNLTGTHSFNSNNRANIGIGTNTGGQTFDSRFQQNNRQPSNIHQPLPTQKYQQSTIQTRPQPQAVPVAVAPRPIETKQIPTTSPIRKPPQAHYMTAAPQSAMTYNQYSNFDQQMIRGRHY
ncbi:putative membrane protein [Wickerhamomyces ciferrii]|uniref:Membrane protein n=1 Tax=Wickerhamomyces ciferrii (strain ATCC 14091 / BCRC 22168 / CBS 111 / JCM 3599 / NBRC 0793 / NRRL Y-1031 F-60-10) TaxID=1206466 RepID=K0KQQ9_WICCF|nr:uncharacterized protein BN7_3227 [Wickerhamomyces ciferrii]CCH43674.1 putative membrane protein [Wickerhamomyces ciferrii]